MFQQVRSQCCSRFDNSFFTENTEFQTDSLDKGEGETMNFTAHNIQLDNGSFTKPGAPLMSDYANTISMRKILNLVFPSNKKSYRVVDLGCLEGGYTVELARMGFNALGLEVREEGIACCNYVKQNLDLENLSFVRDSAWNIDRYGPFDASVCCGLFYHFDNPKAFLEKLARQTKKLLILDTHFAMPTDSGVKQFNLGPMDVHEGLPGRLYYEFDQSLPLEQREKLRWSSYENDKSFWIQKEYLLGLIYELGFTTVFEQYDRWGPNMGEYLDKQYPSGLRGTFIGIRDA